METEGLDFKGALESLAGRFGVKLETEDEDPEAAARRQRRERMYSLLDRAATYYSRYLWEAGEATAAREYLLGRGLEEQTLREFRVGYAPSAWDRILLASRRAGFSDEELLAVGLAQRSRNRPGSVYDRFRERIMFPAVDARGRVHGFGARRMRENQGGAKYLNTSDGELYHKREVLFGIDLARSAAAKTGRMILVEGYTDVLALHQAGIRNSVGIMGTSLTEEQVGELERVVKVLELCLDADRAGQEAMLRAARVAAGRRLELRVVPLPEGQDPADLVEREGAGALRTRVESSQAFVAFNVDHILDRADTRSAEGKDRALGELRPMIRELGGSVLHDDLLRRIAGRLELTFAQAAALASDFSARRAAPAPGAPARPSNGSGGDGGAGPTHTVRSERLFLGVCIAVPDSGARALNEIEIDELLTSAPLRRAARHLANHVRTPLAELPAEDDELARTMSGLVDLAGRVPDPSPDRLEHARLILELERLDRAIIRARHEGVGTSQLARDREAVRESMHTVVARLESTL
jgi:DNA primase